MDVQMPCGSWFDCRPMRDYSSLGMFWIMIRGAVKGFIYRRAWKAITDFGFKFNLTESLVFRLLSNFHIPLNTQVRRRIQQTQQVSLNPQPSPPPQKQWYKWKHWILTMNSVCVCTQYRAKHTSQVCNHYSPLPLCVIIKCFMNLLNGRIILIYVSQPSSKRWYFLML